MKVRTFLNSEQSIFYFPRLCCKSTNSETWLFPHLNVNGETFNNLIHIIFDHPFADIIVFSEDKCLEMNEVQISKISNLVHDVYGDFTIQVIIVSDVYEVDIHVELAKLGKENTNVFR